MKKLLSMLLLALPMIVFGQGITRQVRVPEVLLMSRHLGGAVAASTAYTRTKLPADRGFQVTAVTSAINSGPAAAGAGTVVFRITDGTNNCDCTANCTTTAPHFGSTNAPVRIDGAACAGTCTFAPSASLLLQTTTANCASTLPTVVSVDVRGIWK